MTMLDMKLIREKPDEVRKAIRAKNTDIDLDMLLELDKKKRNLLREVEKLRSEKNEISTQIGQMLKKKVNAKDLIDKNKAISQKISDFIPEMEDISNRLHNILMSIPNIPHNDVPIGKDGSSNQLVKEWGQVPEFDFKPKDHIEILESLGMMNFKMAGKISSSGFALYLGQGARLERALINFMLDLHTKEHHYTEVFPPFLVNRASMEGTGQLPKLESDMYCLKEDDLFLIPTAEVPLTNMYRDYLFKEEDLPCRLTAFSGCFRREAGSYGKDTKGLQRVHQFNKVELVKFVKPERSYDELESLLKDAETVLQRLQLPYRVQLLSSGDMSFAAAKCYDIEVWAPGMAKWLEVSSCSNFEDFQARRARIKFADTNKKESNFVHTLNGSGLALPRFVIALVENYQLADGSIKVPEALRGYIDGAQTLGG